MPRAPKQHRRGRARIGQRDQRQDRLRALGEAALQRSEGRLGGERSSLRRSVTARAKTVAASSVVGSAAAWSARAARCPAARLTAFGPALAGRGASTAGAGGTGAGTAPGKAPDSAAAMDRIADEAAALRALVRAARAGSECATEISPRRTRTRMAPLATPATSKAIAAAAPMRTAWKRGPRDRRAPASLRVLASARRPAPVPRSDRNQSSHAR